MKIPGFGAKFSNLTAESSLTGNRSTFWSMEVWHDFLGELAFNAVVQVGEISNLNYSFSSLLSFRGSYDPS